MSNSYFQFKQFTVYQDRCAMKVTTDGCLFGAWLVQVVKSQKLKVKNALDIGTGTGLITLMFAQKNPEAIIDAIEIDKNAAGQATENVGGSPWKQKINIISDDVRSFDFPRQYDLIISNPPFYEKEIRTSTKLKNIAHHGEELTLEQLLIVIKKNLADGGTFFILLPYKRSEEIKKRFKGHGLHMDNILFVRQSINHDYFRIIIKGKLKKDQNEETEFDEIAIWDQDQKYTKGFVELLKDYYLHL